MCARRLILASGSPRRRAFLNDLQLDYSVVTADIDESPLPGEQPVALALRLALEKARAVGRRVSPTEEPLIIAADTVVALGSRLLGKPADAAEVFAMLSALRGREHAVITAVTVLDLADGRAHTRVNETLVNMRSYSDDEIVAYTATGDPFDKAGAYAIQHPGFRPAHAIRGCISSVIGLPLADLRELLAECGVPVDLPLAPICHSETGFTCCQIAPAQDLDTETA